MSNIDEKLVLVVEDFITKEEAEKLKEVVLENSAYDPRPNYRTFGIGNNEVIDESDPLPWDTENIVHKVGQYAYKFFKNHYQLNETFTLNRVFGNIMDKGAYLNSHEDYSYGENQEHDPTKKSFVCGLFLNDDYGGGEIGFYLEELLSFKPRTGTIILFNGHAVRHGVAEILENSRINILYMFYYTDSVQS